MIKVFKNMGMFFNIFSLIHSMFLLILFFISNVFIGQTDSSIVYKNQIKISPIRLWGNDRGIELNYERQINAHFSTQITTRYIIDIFRATNARSYNQLKGVAIYLEPKYYLPYKNQSKVFFSLTFGYLQNTFENIDEFINPNADSINKLEYFYKDTVRINRQAFDLNFNCGVQKYYKNFVFEFSAGIGLRYRQVKLSNKLNEDQIMTKGLHEFLIFPHREGSYFVPNVSLRLKIGYMF